MTPRRLLKPGRFSRTYATTSGTSRNLVDDGDALLAALSRPTASECARRIRVGGAGVLHVQYADGVQDTIVCLVGDVFDAYFAKILGDTSTASNVTVWW
jgi:hypothetical protein